MAKGEEGLQQRLQRLQAAMGPRELRRASRAERRAERRGRKGGAPFTLVPIAVAFIAYAIATGKSGLLLPGIMLAVIAGMRALRWALRPREDAVLPKVGMGAEIAEGAVVEAGAVVEMGADIHRGAIVRKGAVVRMGADVHDGAVIEGGAVIGWGADVEAGAVVEKGAIIGAGATVSAGARVPAGTRVAPGGTWGSGSAASVVPEAPVDDRRSRIDASCARIEAELKSLPETFREHLGATGETASALRSTCLELLEREKALRAEASDESLRFLEKERAELERKVAAASDEVVKKSLGHAVAAIEDQKRQRLQVKVHADRLDAEVTRLQWTLDGMATQLMRLRSTGGEAGKPPSAEVMSSVQQLHAEIDAITEALEEVRKTDDPMLTPISDVGGAEASPGRDRVSG